MQAALESGLIKCGKRGGGGIVTVSGGGGPGASASAGAARWQAAIVTAIFVPSRVNRPSRTSLRPYRVAVSRRGEPAIQVVCRDFQPVPVGIQQMSNPSLLFFHPPTPAARSDGRRKPELVQARCQTRHDCNLWPAGGSGDRQSAEIAEVR